MPRIWSRSATSCTRSSTSRATDTGCPPEQPLNWQASLPLRKVWLYIRGMTTPDITAILEELAAGHIDAAEAGRRIDAQKAAESAPEPTNEELAAEELTDSDPWAAATDRPQHATHVTDSFASSE